MPQKPIRLFIAALLLLISLAGCYTNPGPAGLTPIPTLAAQPTLAAVAAVTPSATGAPIAAAPGQAGAVGVAGATPAATAAAEPAAASATVAAPGATSAPAGAAGAGSAQGNPQEGQQLFAANCTPCHGANAQGTPGLAPALRSNKFIQAGPDSAIFQTIANGRPGTAMPAWSQAKGGKLTDAQIYSLIAYLKTLQ